MQKEENNINASDVRYKHSNFYVVDSFLSNLTYEFVYTPHNIPGNLFKIRDINDYPVLYTAIIENIDIFITGDKDFSDVDIEMPKIMTLIEFMEEYVD